MNKNWKYKYHNKNNIIDLIFDLCFDINSYLKKNKHIQDIRNFFKKFKKVKSKKQHGFKYKQYGFEYKDYSDSIEKFNNKFESTEIKIKQNIEPKVYPKYFREGTEVKAPKEILKKRQLITEQTEPSIQEVVDALNIKINYAEKITNFFVSIVMLIAVIFVGIYETSKYLIMRLIKTIKYLLKLPYREIIKVAIIIILIGGSISLIIVAYSVIDRLVGEQKKYDDREKAIYKYVDDRFIPVYSKIETVENKQKEIDGNTITVKHTIDSRIYTDKYGKIISIKEKIR